MKSEGSATIYINKNPVAKHDDYGKHRQYLKGLVQNLYQLLYGEVPQSLNEAAEVLRKKHKIRVHAEGGWTHSFGPLDGLASEDPEVREQTVEYAAQALLCVT